VSSKLFEDTYVLRLKYTWWGWRGRSGTIDGRFYCC